MATKKNHGEPLWYALAKAEGIDPTGIDHHTLALVKAADLPQPIAKRKARRADFVHPAERPNVDAVLTELSNFDDAHRTFGTFGGRTARQVALQAETDVYNAWVLMQCIKNNLRSPGAISRSQFQERFWDGDDHGGVS